MSGIVAAEFVAKLGHGLVVNEKKKTSCQDTLESSPLGLGRVDMRRLLNWLLCAKSMLCLARERDHSDVAWVFLCTSHVHHQLLVHPWLIEAQGKHQVWIAPPFQTHEY